MKIRIIDFGLPENHRPLRSHANDAGADVYMPFDCTLEPGGIAKIPLGFGLEVPDGYAAYVFPRSSLAAKGVVCELPPVDSGYRGEIHAIVSNVGNEARTLPKDSRIGQLTRIFDGGICDLFSSHHFFLICKLAVKVCSPDEVKLPYKMWLPLLAIPLISVLGVAYISYLATHSSLSIEDTNMGLCDDRNRKRADGGLFHRVPENRKSPESPQYQAFRA